MEKLTIEKFIEKSRKIHGNKYDYSKVDLEHRDEKGRVCIICPEHGEFWQNPSMHIYGQGCRKCKYEKQRVSQIMTKEEFIEKAIKVHGNKYDYSKVEYKGNKIPVCIICPKHGEFWQKPNAHLNGEGCKKCYGNDVLTTEEFIKRAKEVHGDKYDYSKVEYKGARKRVKIVCPEHGEFEQLPFDHLDGHGCRKCFNEYKCGKGRQLTTEEFIKRAKEIHGDKYDYSKVNYIKNIEKVCIICPEHGEFLQAPFKHLQHQGCPTCSESHIESEVRKILIENGIKFEQEKKFNWLGLQRLDFYLNDYNIAIECQGIQHFEDVPFFNKGKRCDNYLSYIKKLDKKKKELCEKHEVKLYYINFDDNVEKEVKKFLDKNI